MRFIFISLINLLIFGQVCIAQDQKQNVFLSQDYVSSSLSSNVKKVIEREQNLVEKKVKPEISPQMSDLEIVRVMKEVQNERAFKGIIPLSDDSSNNLIISGELLDLGSSKKEAVSDLSFRPLFNTNEEIHSDSLGKVLFSDVLIEGSIVNGALVGPDFIPTNVSLEVSGESYFERTIPLVNRYTFEKFLEKNKLTGSNGFLLVEAEDVVDLVEIDTEYEKQLFLTDSLSVDENNSEDVRYILYVGVRPGNVLLRVQNKNEKFPIEKIVHVYDQEITYQKIFLYKSQEKNLEIYTKSTLSKIETPYDIIGENIQYFNTNIKGEKKAINSYSLVTPRKIDGMTRYVKIKNTNFDYYISNQKREKVIIPDKAFLDTILNYFGIEDFKEQCLINLSLSEGPLEIEIGGFSSKGTSFFNQLYLSKNGDLSEEIYPDTKDVFLLGEGQGIVGIKISYLNGKEEWVQSFCAKNIYLLEQL